MALLFQVAVVLCDEKQAFHLVCLVSQVTTICSAVSSMSQLWQVAGRSGLILCSRWALLNLLW